MRSRGEKKGTHGQRTACRFFFGGGRDPCGCKSSQRLRKVVGKKKNRKEKEDGGSKRRATELIYTRVHAHTHTHAHEKYIYIKERVNQVPRHRRSRARRGLRGRTQEKRTITKGVCRLEAETSRSKKKHKRRWVGEGAGEGDTKQRRRKMGTRTDTHAHAHTQIHARNK